MKKRILVLLITSICAVAANSAAPANANQEPTTSASSQAAQLQPGTLIYAELSKSIDTKKAKVGDPVVAKVIQAVLSQGKLAIPKNSKIVGHLASAKAHTKDQPNSELGIAFDRAELKDGTQIPLSRMTIQAMAGFNLDQQPSNIANGTGGSDASGMSGTRANGPTGGTSPMRGSTHPPASNAGGTGVPTGTDTSTGSPRLNASSRGVIGMSGVRLQPQPEGAVVTEDGKNLKLDSGTQLVLRTQ